MKRSKLTLRGVTVTIGCLLALAFAGPAGAYQAQDRHTLRPDGSFEESYPPILAMAPSLFSPSAEECEASAACDLIQLDVLVDEPGANHLQLTLEWDDPLGQDDLDFYLWDSSGEEVTHAASSANPERMGVADTTGGTFYMGVVHWAGQNSGYTIRGSFALQTVDLSAYDTSDDRPTRPAAPAAPARSAPRTSAPSTEGAPEPAAPTERVDVPGADGAPGDYDLSALPASAQGGPLDDGSPIGDVLPVAVLSLISVTATAWLVVRIRREIS